MRRIGALAILLVAAGALFVLQKEDLRTGEMVPLEIPIASLDFGEAWSQPDFQWIVPVYNRSSHDLVVTDINVSCKCTRVVPTSFKIAPGDQLNVSFTIDLTSNNTNPPGMLREFKLDFALALDSRRVPIYHAVLTGRVKNYLSLSVPTLEFEQDDYIVETRRYRTKQVALASAEPLASIAISVEPPILDASHELNGTSGAVNVRPKDDVPSGAFSAVVNISGVPATGEQRPSQSFVVSGNIQRDVLLSPTHLSFGPASIGSYRQATVSLKSRTGVPLTVEATEVTNPNISIQKVNMPSILGEVFSVGCRISKAGVENSVVEILVRRSVDESERLRLQVSCIGVSHIETAR